MKKLFNFLSKLLVQHIEVDVKTLSTRELVNTLKKSRPGSSLSRMCMDELVKRSHQIS